MDDRSSQLALAALAAGAIAVVGFSLAASLDLFAPCRIVYRMQPAVYGSLECQLYAAITLFSLLLSAVAGIVAIVVAVRVCLWRAARRRG